jgi:GNAT superfamily N-acetyltransferase
MNAVLQPSMVIAQEHYSDGFWAELKPLIERNWAESESYEPEIPVDPDVDRYRKLDAAGALQCLTARYDGMLVGYAVFMLGYSIHHRTILCAHGDAVYVLPQLGRYDAVVALIEESERRLRARGTKRLAWWCEPRSKLARILASLGYTPDEILMEKVL